MSHGSITVGQVRRMKILEMLVENDFCLVDSNVSRQLGLRIDAVKSHFDYLAERFSPLLLERGVHTLQINPIIKELYSMKFFRKFLKEKPAKNIIARYIVKELITSNDHIALGAGSTALCIVSELISRKKLPEAIVTVNSIAYFVLRISGYAAAEKPHLTEDVQSQEIRGEKAADFIRGQNTNKSIVSFGGVSKAGELMVFEEPQRPVKLEMLSYRNREKIIIVLDNTKIGHIAGPVVMNIHSLHPKKYFVLVTDNNLSNQKRKILKSFERLVDVKIAS